MESDWLIIDGYNLLYQHEEFAEALKHNLQTARDRLIRFIEKAAQELAPQTSIIFDGKEMGADDAFSEGPIEVFFSPSNLTADSVIEKLVCKYDTPSKILVVTSDLAEQHTVLSAGANIMSAQEFITQCNRVNSRNISLKTPKKSNPTLGDMFPEL